jgi:hypothetical protein
MKRLFCFFALGASITFAPAARADLIFQAALLPGNEVPPHSTPGVGFSTVTLHSDNITLDVNETFSGLSAPASAAHIHCCAPIGTNAGVALPFTGFPAATSGTYIQTFNLTTDLLPAFVTANGGTGAAAAVVFVNGLETGNTYANIHNTPFPGGEIRGQLEPAPEPATLTLAGACLLGILLLRRRVA